MIITFQILTVAFRRRWGQKTFRVQFRGFDLNFFFLILKRLLLYVQIYLSSLFPLVFHLMIAVHKGQIKTKSVWARHRFSQKMNEQICFVCREQQKSKHNKLVFSFLGRIYSVPICFWFYLTFFIYSLDKLKPKTKTKN